MLAKHTLLVPLLVTTAFTLAQTTHADTLGLRAGVEYWNADLSGEAQSQTARIKKTGKPVKFDEWQFYGETYNSVWVNFEHPVPLVPNIRMTYTNIENAKSRTVRYGTPALYYYRQESVALTFDNIDFTFYYEVLDNWINLDVGLTARSLNGDFEALSLTTGKIQITEPTQDRTKLNEVVPMLYLNGRINIPFVDGLYVQSVFNGATLKGNTLYDADVRVGYDLDLVALDIGIYGGYRRMALKSTDLGNLYADAYMDGLIAGLEVHF
ncbi:MAG TPA: TIGR04219 family outer membrane beta-barrel protein [Cellvibrionaceae bacterium]|nr:TIGR04219 family outer membrane beta-barrel protein [Cellvibrionaceae bacterium]